MVHTLQYAFSIETAGDHLDGLVRIWFDKE